MILAGGGMPAVGWISGRSGAQVCIICAPTRADADELFNGEAEAIDRITAEEYEAICRDCGRKLEEIPLDEIEN